MLWEEVKTIIDGLRQKDSVLIEFCYAPHGDAVFIHGGYEGTALSGCLLGTGSGHEALEDALQNAHAKIEEL